MRCLPEADETAGEADDSPDDANDAVLGLGVVFATCAASEDCAT